MKENKEFKERKEVKENFKEGIKDNKEFKDSKDGKEFKEGKEFEGLNRLETDQLVTRGATPGSGGSDLEARVAGLEAAVAELTHFIAPRLRPDVR